MRDRDLGLVAHSVKYAHVVAAVRWQFGGSWLVRMPIIARLGAKDRARTPCG